MLLGFTISSVFAQDLSDVTKKDAYKISGGLSMSNVFYGVSGIEARRDPYYWQINGNVTFKVAGINVPLSASFSQQERKFTQPFNQIGLSPEYKAITAHAGYRSMNFSTYTLGGVTFLGGGVEVKPEKGLIQGAVMYGRLARAVQEGGNDGQVVGIAAYEQWGYGAKLRFGTDKKNIGIMAFRGKDDASSLDTAGLPLELTPEENLVWGLTSDYQITKKLKFKGEFGFSAFTNNTRNEEVILNNFSYYNNLGGLFTPNATTQFNKAVNTGLGYTHEKVNVQLKYRRIDPDYQTLGSPFLSNDIEDLTASTSWQLFKTKVNMTLTGGVQRNNLDDSQFARVVRLASGVNLTYQVNPKLSTRLSYSNFNTQTNQVQFIEIDSIDYFQVTSNVNGGANYNFGSKERKQALIANASVQSANDSQDNQTNVLNGNLGYQLVFVSLGLSTNTSFTYNNASFGDISTVSLGPTVSLSKAWFKKTFQTSFVFNYLSTSSNAEQLFDILNYSLNLKYKWRKNHSFSLAGVLLDRASYQEGSDSFTERRVTLQYGYRF